MLLQGLRNLYATRPIGIGLDHANQLGVRMQETAIIIKIFHHRIEVYFERGLVYAFHKEVGDLLEVKAACPFQQDNFIVELAKGRTGDEVLNGGEEMLLGHLDG